MPDKLTVRGKDLTDVTPLITASKEPDLIDIGYRVEQRVSTVPALRGVATEVPIDGRDTDILELTDSNGVTDFMSMTEARGMAARSRGRLGLALASGERGGGGVTEIVRSSIDLRQFADDLKQFAELRNRIQDPLKLALDPMARIVMTRIAEKIDRPVDDSAPSETRRKRAKVRGVYSIGPSLELEPSGREHEIAQADEPFLVLLHGTFSHTEASFKGFLRDREPTPQWRDLAREYEGRLLALEHETLSRTPVQNAIALADRLPDGARLHLLSHSRGGLVGEVLSYTAHQEPSTKVYERVPHHPDRDGLMQLHRLLNDKRITVERFVRVACPARGTILASRKVDRWATYLFNALRLTTGGFGDGVLAVVKKVLLVLLDQRADVRAVPGIEAMMPDSPLVATLAAARELNDGLCSVTGDVEGKGILGKIALALPDLFFEGDHDLVVSTSAMDGGMRRTPRTQPIQFKGPAHNHFSYFSSDRSRAEIGRLVLNGPEHAAARGQTEGAGMATNLRTTSKKQKRIVVLVPGLTGTGLQVDGKLIWPHPTEIMRRGAASFLDPTRDVQTAGLTEPYDELERVLGTEFRVHKFGYDWRRSLLAASNALLGELATNRSELSGMVAHGAGCVVSQLAFLQDPGLFSPLRVVMLDPPFDHDPAVTARRSLEDHLGAVLVMLDREARVDELAGLMKTHATLGELTDGGRRLLSDTERAHQRNGVPPRTSLNACVHDSARSRQGPLTTGAQNFLARVQGGSLLSTPDVLGDVRRLLLGQRPAALIPGQPGSRLMKAEDVVELGTTDSVADEKRRREERVLERASRMLFPTELELAHLGLGARQSISSEPPALLVRVTHGDLRTANGPWIVGAQDGTPIGGAEKALDERLEHVLTTHRLLGQYPGAPGTLQLFASADIHGPAAAVIGLGDPGDLTPGSLTAGITQAVLRLAAANAAILSSEPLKPVGAETGLDISCVLIGTVGPAALPIESSTNAIITGVRRANRRLRDLKSLDNGHGGVTPPVVASLEIHELYEDRAVQALTAATKLAATDGASEADALQVVESLQIGDDGRKGSTASSYLSDRWRTVRVSAPRSPQDGSEQDTPTQGELLQLTFTEVGRSAGAPTVVSSGQRRIIDEVIRESIITPSARNGQIHNTLYELIVPIQMKGQGRPSENFMFILDEHAARLPLEMMATRSFDDGIVPLAAEVGLIRRLETGLLRERVRPASGTRALVIGDPRAKGWQPLPGARMEAGLVADTLEAGGYDVERLISAADDDVTVDTTRVLNALYAHDYRILHVAGHGTSGDINGVVIGDDALLTAIEIQQMQTTPDLVFLNCCHLGSGIASRPQHHDGPTWRPDIFAAGIARQLIDNGVRAVVAAGWAVDDSAAETFAGRFYEHWLAGEDLGRASLDARKAVWRRHPSSTTWGAYQVYGPPAFLAPLARPHRRGGTANSPQMVRERLAELGRDAARLPHGADGDRVMATLEASLETLVANTPDNWLDGEMHQAIGEVWRNLGRYEEAIERFQIALGRWSSAAGLNVIDQIVSANVRRGAELAQDRRRRAQARRSFTAAQRLLDEVDRMMGLDGVVLNRPPELWRLQANFHQHHLWMRLSDTTEKKHEALREVHECFRNAADAFEARDQHADRYSRLGEIVFRWLREDHTDGVDRETVKVLREAAVKGRWSPRAFAQLGPADCDLVTHLIWKPDPACVVREYQIAFDRGVSLRERETIRDYMRLLRQLLDGRQEAASLLDIEEDLFGVG